MASSFAFESDSELKIPIPNTNDPDNGIVIVPHRDDASSSSINSSSDKNNNYHGDNHHHHKEEPMLQYAYTYSQDISIPTPPSNDNDNDCTEEEEEIETELKKDVENNNDKNKEDEDEEDEQTSLYPKDSYSFLALNGPLDDNPFLFLFGLMPFLFQFGFLLLMILSVVKPDLQTGDIEEGVDNPGNPFHSSGGIATFIPANTSPLARTTQIVSILSFLVFADETILDICRSIELLPPLFWSNNKNKNRNKKNNQQEDDDDVFRARLLFSCVLRLIQGLMAVAAVFLLVMTESSVIEIVLNFTAVNFISGLDETAFVLARWGKFGPSLRKEARRISNKELPSFVNSRRVRGWYAAAVVPVAMVVLVLMVLIVKHQQNPDKWITRTFRVQFDREDGTEGLFESYSGCYHMDLGSSRHFGRYVYASDEQNAKAAKLGYCLDDRQWVFYEDDSDENGNGNADIDPCSTSENQLAHSSRTSTFDVSTSFGEDWFSYFNTPLSMYFIEEENETILRQNCGSFVGDGICDAEFNNFYYRYDGGDCCASTCSGDRCGTVKQSQSNSNSNDRAAELELEPPNNEIAFPDCKNPSMTTIELEIVSIKIDKKNQTWWANTVQSLEGWEDLWRPRFVLQCGGHTVLATSRLESLEGRVIEAKIDAMAQTQTQNCVITTEHFDLVWNANYTITTPSSSTISMEEKRSNPIPSRIGMLTQETMLDRIDLRGNAFTGTIPSEIGLNSNLTTLLLDNNALTGKIPIDLEKLESLQELSLSNNALSGTFPWRLLWRPRSLTKLNFDDNLLTGRLPTEIALLTSLTHLSLYNNDFYGLIPSEIKKLTNLKTLNLGRNSFLGTFPSEIIAALTNLEYLNIEHNSFDGTVPTEIESLTLLKELNLAQNSFNATLSYDFSSLSSLTLLDLGHNSFSSSFPISIQNLTNLTHLDLGQNLFVGDFPGDLFDSLSQLTYLDLYGNDLIGTLPTAIAKLRNLEHLVLADIGLTGTIPAEIGRLVRLKYLDLEGNLLRGQIPPQIGKLYELINLDVGQNLLTGPIPTEIGLLTRLSGLWMYYNMLKGTIPCELESLTNLSGLNLNFNYLTGMIPRGLTVDFLHVHIQRESQLLYSLTDDCGTTTTTTRPTSSNSKAYDNGGSVAFHGG